MDSDESENDDVINFSQDEDEASDFDDSGKGDDGLIYSGEEAVSVDESKINDSKPLSNETPEERKKRIRIEKLEKRIKTLSKKQDKNKPKRPEKFQRIASEIKNKHKRQEVVIRRKEDNNANKKIKKL